MVYEICRGSVGRPSAHLTHRPGDGACIYVAPLGLFTTEKLPDAYGGTEGKLLADHGLRQATRSHCRPRVCQPHNRPRTQPLCWLSGILKGIFCTTPPGRLVLLTWSAATQAIC